MAAYDNFVLKVEYNTFEDKISSLETLKATMEGILQKVDGYLKTLMDEWHSDSGVTFQGKYLYLRREIQDSLDALQAHIDHLRKAVETYRTSESNRQNMINGLEDGDIFRTQDIF